MAFKQKTINAGLAALSRGEDLNHPNIEAARRAVTGAKMSEFTGLVISTLERKRRIDRENASVNNMAGYDRWLVDAVELLLQIELERRGNPK